MLFKARGVSPVFFLFSPPPMQPSRRLCDAGAVCVFAVWGTTSKRLITRRTHNAVRNKVAIVTGAATGIGQAIAIRFAQEGASVIVDYVGKPGSADDTIQKITSAAQGGGG